MEQNKALGKNNTDVDFELLVQKAKYQKSLLSAHNPAINLKLCVCVRKRIIFKKEVLNGEIDCVSVANPKIKILANKFKVDGITKYVDTSEFDFDNTFNENESTQDLY